MNIAVSLPRQYAEDLQKHLFPFLKLLKQTKLNNVAKSSTQSKEYLTVLIMNCLTDELMLAINKKIMNTAGKKLKLKLSDVLAVVFFQTLISWPIDQNQFYLNNMRNWLVQEIDKQLTSNLVYQRGAKDKNPETEPSWFVFDEED